jgi:hypothetical protein
MEKKKLDMKPIQQEPVPQIDINESEERNS